MLDTARAPVPTRLVLSLLGLCSPYVASAVPTLACFLPAWLVFTAVRILGEGWRCDRKLVLVEIFRGYVVFRALVGSNLGSFFGVAVLFHALDHARFQGLSLFD